MNKEKSDAVTGGSEVSRVIKVGQRVKLIAPVDRFSDFWVDKGATGTVAMTDLNQINVKMDEFIAGCEDWDNEIIFDVEEYNSATADI